MSYQHLMLTYDNVCWLAAKLGGYPLEARLLPNLGGGVHVLHGEDGPQPEQEDFGEGRHQLKQQHPKMLVHPVSFSS